MATDVKSLKLITPDCDKDSGYIPIDCSKSDIRSAIIFWNLINCLSQEKYSMLNKSQKKLEHQIYERKKTNIFLHKVK